jgi:hypothetical protein
MTFVCATYAAGAPSLRSLQGRVAMLPTQLLSFCCFVCASEIKSLGHMAVRLNAVKSKIEVKSVGQSLP